MQTPAQKTARQRNWQLFRIQSMIANLNVINQELKGTHPPLTFDLNVAKARLSAMISYLKEKT